MNTPVTRYTFIRQMVDSGLTFENANLAYNSMLTTLSDGVVNGRKVYLGQVGVLKPTVMPPRSVKMGFAVTKGRKVVKEQREFYLDSRIKYTFRMFKKFARTHELKWV